MKRALLITLQIAVTLFGLWLVFGKPEQRQEMADALRTAIEGSYDQLPTELRLFFARLSVFRGGWTLAAAEAVCEGGVGEWKSGGVEAPEQLTIDNCQLSIVNS